MGPGGGNSKRRTHADNIPDSEKPFSCEREYFFYVLFYSSYQYYKDFRHISITSCINHVFTK